MPSTKEVAQDLSADILAIKDKLTDDEFKNIQDKLGGLSESKPDRPQFVKVSYALVQAVSEYDEDREYLSCEVNSKICHAILEIINIPDVCICNLPEEFRDSHHLHMMFHQKCKISSKTIEKFHTGTNDKTYEDRMCVAHFEGDRRSVIIIQNISEPF